MGDSLAGALAVNFHKSCGWALTGLSGKALTRSMAEVRGSPPLKEGGG